MPWYRKPSGDNGIYGWQTQLTVTGPYVNVTMFEDAGVDMPEEGASWDDWAEALRQVNLSYLTAGLAPIGLRIDGQVLLSWSKISQRRCTHPS